MRDRINYNQCVIGNLRTLLARLAVLNAPLLVANPQPVRTVVARPIVARLALPPPPPPPAPVAIAVAAPTPAPVVARLVPVATVQAAPATAAAAPEEPQRPRAYSFSYDTEHEDGSNQRREESSDANGVVRGSYSYRDADGLFRTVEYIADENGYRANIRTNEPGVSPGQPADVQLQLEPVPEAVLQKYSAARAPVAAAPAVVVAARATPAPAPPTVRVATVQAAPISGMTNRNLCVVRILKLF